MDALLERLRREGLLQPAFLEAAREAEGEAEPDPLPGRRSAPPHLRVLALCEQGALQGGLSVALDVRPDELIGPLCAAVGGSAPRLRVLDVREGPPLEIRIGYGGLEEPWEVEDLYALVQNLNDLLREDPRARAVAVLGEWQDALQLWCVPKAALGGLLRADYFAPRNRHQLEALARGPRG